MPITLNHSNISVQYETGSNYIIETVKSDLYLRDSRTGISSNLTTEPTVSPSITSNLAIFTHSGGTENQTSHSIYFPENIECDILIVGGGGGGGNGISTMWEGGGGGAGGIVYMVNKTLNAGTYKINVGKGGNSNTNGDDSTITYNNNNNITFDNIQLIGRGGGKGTSVANVPGSNGGSGGGGAEPATNGGVATQGNTFWNGTSYAAGGFNGGKPPAGSQGAGGGGASEVGNTDGSGFGGDGRQVNISGVNTFYAGGGNAFPNTSTTRSDGGGGTLNGTSGYQNGGDALPNTGSGGCGAYSPGFFGGKGGSGIVIIRVISPTTHKYLFFNYLPAQPTLNYTINFPTRTMVNFVNSADEVMSGQYTVSVRTTQSTITPIQGQNLQYRLYYTSNLSLRYHLLNPILDPIGAQWTYNTSNTNVYHKGSVGIGTTNPEYQLDVIGTLNAKAYYFNGVQIGRLSEGMVANVQHLTYTHMEVKNNTGWDAINDNLTTGFVISITPKSNLSKILVNLVAHIGLTSEYDGRWWGIKLYRKIGTDAWTEVTGPNGTETGSAATTAGTPVWISNNIGTTTVYYPLQIINLTGTYLDSPNTTSIVYYTAYWNQRIGDNPSRTGELWLNRAANQNDAYRPAPSSSWTVKEIWYG